MYVLPSRNTLFCTIINSIRNARYIINFLANIFTLCVTLLAFEWGFLTFLKIYIIYPMFTGNCLVSQRWNNFLNPLSSFGACLIQTNKEINNLIFSLHKTCIAIDNSFKVTVIVNFLKAALTKLLVKCMHNIYRIYNT